nr:Arm DNA-binding domain-containing protein [Sphingobium subterraneum]
MPGLSIRVSPNGQRRWSANYRFGTQQRRLGLGGYPQTSLARAREKMVEILWQVDEGIDPAMAARIHQIRCAVVHAGEKDMIWKTSLTAMQRSNRSSRR